MEYVTLNNGVKMPVLGYGVYQVSNEECERCVLDAISVGYRSIDTAQAALRFLIQSGVVVIPKSAHKDRMIQNMEVFDFALDAEDMAAIQALDGKESLFFSHYDPATVEMLTGLHR
ncbi:MAG: aldo/keto reductase [Eubacteriales bacterium]|nr:aldo/keto reductase [Eubacteriales bacterium]